MLVFVLLILYLRQPVSTLLQANTDRGAERWYTNQIAVYWHVPALLYLFILWFVWIGRVITGTMVRNGSFLVSLLIIPIYLVLSYVGYVVIASVVDSLSLSRLQTKDDKPGEEDMVDEQYSINQKKNVMLRHHLGMLQIVPHSDLGAVTNFNRGGIVIKFPLEFPYDTDIDQVRKIIKGVGQEMLEDEETGGGFIKPIKSQGVHGISNSVMVIRVKFTAKPGTQFVIKREAYRRLTEAFNAKGIHYAHRKVIVDFPEVDKTAPVDQETRNNLLRAGAAVVLADETDQNMAKE